MEDALAARCMLFFDDLDALYKSFKLESRFAAAACAAMLASRGKALERSSAEGLKRTVKKRVRVFSGLRSVLLPIVALMAQSDAPGDALERVREAYAAIRTKFGANEYAALAAVMLAASGREQKFSEAAEGVRAVYDAFKAKHRFRTCSSDIPLCALMFQKGIDPKAAAEDADECFKLLRKEHRYGCRWAIAQTLALDPRGANEKCAALMELRARLKKENRLLSLYYELSALACLPEGTEAGSPEVMATYDLISGRRGLKAWSLDRGERLMISHILVEPSDELFCLALARNFEKQAAAAAAA